MINWRTQNWLRRFEAITTGTLFLALGMVGKASAKAVFTAPDTDKTGTKGTIDQSEQFTAKMPRQIMPSGGKPQILIFTAEWCEPCHLMEDAIEQSKAKYGDSAEVKVLDLDAPENAALVEKLNVTMVPAVFYTESDGTVKAETIGYAGKDAFFHFLDSVVRVKIATK